MDQRTREAIREATAGARFFLIVLAIGLMAVGLHPLVAIPGAMILDGLFCFTCICVATWVTERRAKRPPAVGSRAWRESLGYDA